MKLGEQLLNSESKKNWQKIGSQKRAGTVAPLSFLRSKNSLGIGNFEDLKYLIDLALQKGETIVQILPITDSGNNYLWPYSTISSFAINPVYISPNKVFTKYKKYLDEVTIKKHRELIKIAQKEEINNIINYPVVRKNILNILKNIYYPIHEHLSSDITGFTKVFSWVKDYALFSQISNMHKDTAWFDWQHEDLKNYDLDFIKSFYKKYQREVDFFIFCQIEALSQAQEVHLYALANKVFIKGDIPILVDINSADVWSKRELFLLDYGAGAPPDMFTTGGQEWGNPPINMQSTEAINYFISRFEFGQQYMDIVRIDHVLGLFRLMIWNKSKGNITNQGFFYPQILNKNAIVITHKELLEIGLNPEQFTKLEGCITDKTNLPKISQKLVEDDLAKNIKSFDKIAWICDKKAKNRKDINFEEADLFENNLNINEDTFYKTLKDLHFSKEDTENIACQRRRLQNMLGYYFQNNNCFFFTYYWRETWQYINLPQYKKEKLNNLFHTKLMRQFDFWKNVGTDILTKLIKKTNLLLCAEDLGHVDPYIPGVIKNLGIPGIDIIRWAHSFDLQKQRELTVLTTSTHDTSSLGAWWQEKHTHLHTKKTFIKNFLNTESINFHQPLDKKYLKQIFLKMYEATSIFVILPFWEVLNIWHNEEDKRINEPSYNKNSNWCQRMQKCLTFYLKETNANNEIKTAVIKNNR